MNKFTGIITLVVIGLLISGLAASKRSAKQGATFDILTNTWVGIGPLYLAQEKGFYEEEGLKVNVVINEDVAARKAALTSGRVESILDTVDSVVLERAENVPAVVALTGAESRGADGILVKNTIKSVSDLKGKEVFVQRNFVSENFLRYMLKQAGVGQNEVSLIDTEAGAAGTAFVAGKADVAVTYEPWLSKAKERKDGSILVSSADAPGILVDAFSVNESYLKNHPAEVKKFIRAWFKAVDYWKKNPAEANAVMAKHYSISPEEFAGLLDGLVWPSYEETVHYFGTTEKPGKLHEVANTFADLMVETGQIKQKPNMQQAIDASLLQDLYAK